MNIAKVALFLSGQFFGGAIDQCDCGGAGTARDSVRCGRGGRRQLGACRSRSRTDSRVAVGPSTTDKASDMTWPGGGLITSNACAYRSRCGMPRDVLAIVTLCCLIFTVSCEQQSPLAPSSNATLDQFVQALRQQGFSVSLAGEVSPEVNGFFSVPARQVRVNESQINAFEYPSAEAAGAEAALISSDGQPNPRVALITWAARHASIIKAVSSCCTWGARQRSFKRFRQPSDLPSRSAGRLAMFPVEGTE